MTVQFNSNQLPTRADMWWEESNESHGFIQAIVASTSQPYGFYAHKTSPVQFDSFTHGFFIKAGAYTISWLGFKSSGSGAVDWFLDPISISPTAFLTGQDWYNSVDAPNTILSTTITIPSDGWHVIKGVLNTKNASSSGYDLRLTKIWLQAASD